MLLRFGKGPALIWNRFYRLGCLSILSAIGSPLLAVTPSHPGVFYVADYAANGDHTDYDMARQAADAYAATSYVSGSVLILKPSVNETCDAVPLPSLGGAATTSIIGSGSSVSTVEKHIGCAASKATLSHPDSINGVLSQGRYQGFTVNANHVDGAACDFYGMSSTTIVDVACGNAVAGADHELEFGNDDANNLGWMDNIYIYDLKTFDSLPAGTGAALKPVWSFGSLAAVTTDKPGTSAYTSQSRAELFGPDLVTCTSVPTLAPKLGAESTIDGAVVTNPGNCSSTEHIYIIVQDGTPVSYGMKFTNMADSHAWNLKATGQTTFGEAWLPGCNNDSIYSEQPGSDQVIEIYDNGNGNRHINPIFTDPAGYAARIDSQNGTFANSLMQWRSANFSAVSGFYLGNDRRVYHDWMLQNSHCADTVDGDFGSIVTEDGLLSSTNLLPGGVKPQNVESCGSSDYLHWATVQ